MKNYSFVGGALALAIFGMSLMYSLKDDNLNGIEIAFLFILFGTAIGFFSISRIARNDEEHTRIEEIKEESEKRNRIWDFFSQN